jgi:hypothetical protein
MTIAALDLTDVMPVGATDLGKALAALQEAGRFDVLARGATEEDREAVEDLFWQRHDGDTATGVATLIRFWSLVAVLQSRRLSNLCLGRGPGLLAASLAIAATARLNCNWGFSPQRFLAALLDGSTLGRSGVLGRTQVIQVAA